jgi:hypothetical protein
MVDNMLMSLMLPFPLVTSELILIDGWWLAQEKIRMEIIEKI